MHDEADLTFATLLCDPLVRLMMASDGVSTREVVEALELARSASVARATWVPARAPDRELA